MRLDTQTIQPIHYLRYLNAARGGGIESQALSFSTAKVTGMPEELDCLVLASDLQGVAPSWREGGANVLLGIQVAEELVTLADAGAIPQPERTGVVLAGDLYSAPGGDTRGATGDVRDVWHAFSESFRWVVGVAGNHDLFGTEKERQRVEALANVDILHGAIVERDGLSMGGVSYIVGNPKKAGRCEESEFFAALDLVLEAEPDLVVLHEGPTGDRGQRGSMAVRQAIGAMPPSLVVCGHRHWDEPTANIGGSQIVNVDARVLLLTR